MADIYKRGKVWWARAQVNGRDCRQSLGTSSRDEAVKRFAKWLEQTRNPVAPASDLSFADAAASFLDVHCAGLKPSSLRRYEASIKKMMPQLGRLMLSEITTATLLAYESARRSDKSKRAVEKGKPERRAITTSTIRRDLDCLSSIFGHAAILLDTDLHNPVPGFKKRRQRAGLREGAPRRRYLSHAEETRLLAAVSRGMQRAAVIFAIDTGAREEEQLSLTRDDLDLANARATFRNTKNGRDRTVPLLPRTVEALAQIPAHIRGRHVFYKQTSGDRFGRLDQGLKLAAARAGIHDLRWHDLRRTCGCRLLQDHDMDIKAVSVFLGHSSVQQTERAYAFLREEDLARKIMSAQKPAQETRNLDDTPKEGAA